MAKKNRPAEELSIEELEAILARKKVDARRERLKRFQQTGRTLRLQQELDPTTGTEDFRAEPDPESDSGDEKSISLRLRESANRFLLVIEAAAVLGLLFVLINGIGAVQSLNQEVAEARRLPSPTPLITAVVLPSGHTPPTSPGGAGPNESEIPQHLRPLVQALPVIEIPTPSPGHVQSIHLPALWDSAAPVVQGDGWEQLKKGVGQHIGSGKPGEAGNVVLSAHNDIFGELFRDLDQLKPGDEIILSSGLRDYVYKVTGLRIVDPTEVSVMDPTSRATVTLISCYPYLVDTQRIVVFGELVDS